MLSKLSRGFLQIMTDTGPRYVKPSFLERLRLIWMFRNFSLLPQQVLSIRQQHLLSALSTEPRLSPYRPPEDERAQLIGTLLTIPVLPPSRGTYERRGQTRCSVQFEVRYGMSGDLCAGEGCDLGSNGIGFTGPRLYPPGTELEIHYRMEPAAKWTKVRALLRHCGSGRMGAEFLSVQK